MGLPETTYERKYTINEEIWLSKSRGNYFKSFAGSGVLSVPIVSLKRRNSYDNTLKDTFEDLIKSVEKILYIAVQMIDTNYLKEIINASKQKC